EKKRKLVTETSDKPSPAKRSKSGLVTKRRKPTSSLRLVDESVDEGIPEKEPRFDDEETDIQRAVGESLKSFHDAPRGSLPPVVIKELDSGKFQPLLEVQGKGKEKVSDEQVSRDLFTLQTPKKEVTPVVEVGAQDKGQAGPNPGVLTGGQAGSDLGDDAEPQPQSSLVVHAGPNLKHMDLEAMDVSTQLHPEQMDKRTTTETKAESMVSAIIQHYTFAIPPMTTPVINLTSRPDYPNVHRPLQATATETTMITTTTTHPPPPQPQQSTIDSMLIKRIGKLKQIMANLIQDNKHLEERLDSHGACLYTLENLNIPQDLPEADMNEILHQRMWETNSYKAHEDHMMLYEALEKSMNPTSFSTTSRFIWNFRISWNFWILTSAASTSSTSIHQLGRPSVSSIPEDLHMDDDMALDKKVHSSDDEDIGNAHVPKAFALASTYTPPPENSLLAHTGPAFTLVKVFYPNVIRLQYQMEEYHKLLTDSVDESIIRYNVSKPLPLGGPPEKMVPNQMWIEEECKYDIAAIAIRTHMRILSVVRIKVFSMYGDKYEVQMIMRFNEIHKFSDGTLHQIDEALDYRVKEFKVNRMNLGLNIRVESSNDNEDLGKDASKQGRKIQDINADERITLVDKTTENQGRFDDQEDQKMLFDEPDDLKEELEQENAKKQKMEDDKESVELKQCLEIIPEYGDDVTIDATPFSSKEDLEVLGRLVKARFEKIKPVDYMDNLLLHNLKTMFKHHVEDNSIPFYLLVEKMYPLTNHTLHQMFNDVKLQVDYECEMAFELLRLVKK
nr:hypothetical protein [Tanacetum cinerariifolium]